MKEWWRSLAVDPEPLTRGQKAALLALAVFTAITRWLALERTLWDWDEALFSLALQRYDVANHHPHPPGFPLFIATAKLFQHVGLSEFHALQAVSLLAAVAIVPAMFLLGRELRAGFRVSIIAAALLAFFPNVWLYGGGGFSDVPSMTLVILAVALTLRGCRSDAALYVGAVTAAIAAGYRPQNLVIVFAPAVIAALHAGVRRASVFLAPLIAVAIIAVSYGYAVALSGGWPRYAQAVAEHQAYITQIDSFRSPGRPPLWQLADNFFLWPYRVIPINLAIAALVFVSAVVTLVKRRMPGLVMLAAFGPFCLLAWLILDRFSVSRFSIGYAPLMAFLAADGLDLLASRWPRIEAAMAAGLVALMIVWTWPSLRVVHTTVSPPLQATEWIARHADPRAGALYVMNGMQPYAQLYLPRFRQRYLYDTSPPSGWKTREDALLLMEGASSAAGARLFSRPHGRLWNLARQRYFEVSVVPLHELVDFREGWYDEEGMTSVWRWMGSRSVSILPSLRGTARLGLTFYVPLDALPEPPTVTVRLNGTVLDRFRATTSDFTKTWEVTPRDGAPNELVIETDRVVNPARVGKGGDTRDLGLRLSGIEWARVESVGPEHRD